MNILLRHFLYFLRSLSPKARKAAALKAAEDKARREAEEKARLERILQRKAWEDAHRCGPYHRWTTCYDNEAFNLPLDTIYYVESERNMVQNYFMRDHLKEIEAYINKYVIGKEPLFPYKIVYVARDNHSLMEQLRQLYPTLHDVEVPAEEKMWPGSKQTVISQVSLMTRVYGTGNRFLEMDSEGVEPERLLSAICDYVYELCSVNRAYVFNDGEEESYDEQTECHYISELGKYPTRIPFVKPERPKEEPQEEPEEECDVRFSVRAEEDALQDKIRDLEIALHFARGREWDRIERQLESARMAYDIHCRKVAAEKARREAERRELEQRRMEEARARALAIKAEIEALQRDNGITILTEILGKPLLDSLRADQPVTTSTLRVDSQYRILLPEYDIEVEMTTLPKALYILFLRHPEGIEYKMMDEYREELRVIYLTISSRSNVEEMQKSINDLVEPGSDSLLQKVSRINAAFRRHLADEVAAPYMIQGPRGEAKRIRIAGEATLPDDLRF